MKPGLKSTEFWITLFTQIGALAAGAENILPGKYAAAVFLVAQVAYALSRGLAKFNTPAEVLPLKGSLSGISLASGEIVRTVETATKTGQK